MEASNWHEAVRRFHPMEQRTYFREGRGEYQLDHVFVTADLAERLTRVAVSTGGNVLRASDHAPVVLESSWPDALVPPDRRA